MAGSIGASDYHSLQVQVRRRVGTGVDVMAAYTFAKALGDTDGGNFGSTYEANLIQDIFDLDDGGSGDSKELQCTPLRAGASVMRSLTFTLPAGNYIMSLVINGQGPLTLGNVIIEECR